MLRTAIEWTDGTWNPTDGCLVCSPGCANCYAMRMAGRFSGPGGRYHGLVTIGKNKRAVWTGVSHLNNALAHPLTWRDPRKVFVDSMSDLFYEGLSDEDIACVFAMMAVTPHITYQVLTKRAARMRAWYRWFTREMTLHTMGTLFEDLLSPRVSSHVMTKWLHKESQVRHVWPLPNAWVGVSVEDRKHGVPRIDELRQVPAAVRMLSCEPLLEDLGTLDLSGIGWLIAGCESGPGARPPRHRWGDQVDWYRSLRDQCRRSGVAFFLKQARPARGISSTYAHRSTEVLSLPELDGVTHAEFPRRMAA